MNPVRITSLCFLIFLSVIVVGQDFTIATASGVDLKKYNTFIVLRGSVIANSDQPIDKEAFYNRIKPSITREMESRGYVASADTVADISVTYVIETTVKLDLQPQGRIVQQVVVTNPVGSNQSDGWSNEFTQGMLIIEIEDTTQKKSVWSAEGLMDINRTRGGDLIDNAVRSAFRKFPDKNKKSKPAKKPR